METEKILSHLGNEILQDVVFEDTKEISSRILYLFTVTIKTCLKRKEHGFLRRVIRKLAEVSRKGFCTFRIQSGNVNFRKT